MLYYTCQETKEKGTLTYFFRLTRHDHDCPEAKNRQFFGQFEDTFITFPWNLIEKTLAPAKGVKIYFLLGFPTLPIFVVPLPRGPPWENLMIWRDFKKYPLIFLIFLRPETAPGLLILVKIDNLDLSYTREVKSHPFLIQLSLINLLNWIKNMCWSLS